MRRRDRRPFYTEFAWAFDLLIDRPVVKECAVIVTWLIKRGVRPGASVLDAGCGTDHSFVMRCWERDELLSHLQACGFTSLDWFGAYEPAIAPGSADRLVVVGRLVTPRT